MVAEKTRKEQIQSVASGLFRERGYAGTSVRDIARGLDIQGASLYAHVDSKESVLWSIVEQAADRFDAAVIPVAESRRPAPERLRAMIAAHIQVITDDLGNAASFLHEWRYLSPQRHELAAARRDAYEARWRAVVRDGIRARQLRHDLDPDLTATLILTALNGLALWYRPGGSRSPGDIATAYADTLLRGLERSQR